MKDKCVEELLQRVRKIHSDCYQLISRTLGKDLPVAGNIGVFCQSEEEYEKFEEVRKGLIKPSGNSKRKYFKLKEPVVIEAGSDTPKAIYRYLYVRKPETTPFGSYLGDIDFVMEPGEYKIFRDSVVAGKVRGTKLFDRPGWDTVQITDPEISSVAFVSTKEFAEKVRVRSN